MKSTFWVTLLIFISACNGAAHASGEISLNGEYWSPRLSGEVGSLQPKNDLGLDKSSIGSINLGFKSERGPRYFLKYDGPSFSNRSTLNHSVSLGDVTHNPNEQIHSELNVNHWQIGLQQERITACGKISVIYSYHHNSIETIIQNDSRNISSRKRDNGDILSLGFAWESLNREGLNYFAEATPLSVGRNAAYQDYNIGIKSKLGKDLTLTTGYRGEKLSAGENSDSIGSRLHLRGWYIFLSAEQ